MQESWKSTEIEGLSKALAVVCIVQNAYGTESQFAARLDFWIMKLEKKYTVNQVIHALDIYTDRHSDVPTPSDIINILNPEKPKITQTEYIANKEKWAKEGYKSHCYYLGIMREFEAQEEQQRNEAKPITDETLLKLAHDSVKKIN
jgi:hypothetical protein